MTAVGKFDKKTIRDVPCEGKTVLVRVDYNVPLASDGTIADDFRIQASLETIRFLQKHRCKIVLISHLGRPEGKKVAKYSLKPVADRLAELLDHPVRFIDDCKGDGVRMTVKKSAATAVMLLENVRFYPEEEANDPAFAQAIAQATHAAYFVQDGFGVVHRAHASTDAITHYIPSVAGLLLEREVRTIRSVMESPEHPLVAVLGGAKISDKIGMIEALEPIADQILIGGAMANTFLQANGIAIGKSKTEAEQRGQAQKIYRQVVERDAGQSTERLLLPTDVAIADTTDARERNVVPVDAIPDSAMALDIGEATIEHFVAAIETAKTVIWNGTLGYAENQTFAHGSARIALALAAHPDIVSVIGGGDTADFVRTWDSRNGESFHHVSTGGGASLELMAGKKLPGVEALLDE